MAIEWRQRVDGSWEYRDGATWYRHRADDGPQPPAAGDEADVPPAPPRAALTGTEVAGALLAVAGGAFMVVAAVLPWWTTVSGGVFTLSGGSFLGPNFAYGVDGVALVLLGVATAAVGIARVSLPALPMAVVRSTVLTGVVAGVICAIGAWRAYGSLHDLVGAGASFGSGLVCGAVGAVAAVAAGLVTRRPRADREAPSGSAG